VDGLERQLSRELVLRRKNAMALTEIHQIQEKEIFKTSAHKIKTVVL